MAVVLRANSPLSIVLAQVIGSALLFLSAPIVARTLGPEGKGEAAATLAAVAIAPFLLGLGLPLAVRRYAAIADDDNGVIRAAVRLSLAAIPFGFVLAVLLSASLLSEVSSNTKVWMTIGLTLAPAAIIRDCLASILVARQRYDRIAVVAISPAVVTLVAVATLAAMGILAPSTVVAISVVSMLIAAALAWVLVRPQMTGPLFPPRELIWMGMKSAGAQIGTVATLGVDQVFLLSLMGPAQLGVYSVAATISKLALPLSRAYGASSFAQIARAPRSTVSRMAARYVSYSAISVGAVAVLIAVSAPIIVPLVFGQPFAGSVQPLWILLAGSVAMSVVLVATSHLVARGYGGRASISLLVGLAFGLAAMWLLAPAHGAVGAAAASTIGYSVSAVLAMYYMKLKASDFRQPDLVRGAVRDLMGS